MPGVLMIEAMAQCGGLLVLNTLEEPERWSTYFMKIDGVKFRQKVVPGDTLIFKVDLLAPVRHGVSSMKGYIFVGDHIVAEATFTAQIVKNNEKNMFRVVASTFSDKGSAASSRDQLRATYPDAWLLFNQ